MHELAAVEETVTWLSGELAARGIERVTAVRFQRGSTFAEEALRQGFIMSSVGTPLEGADVVIDVAEVSVSCACGRQQAVTADDLLGHLFVCPDCGAVQEVEEADDLRVLDVTVPS